MTGAPLGRFKSSNRSESGEFVASADLQRAVDSVDAKLMQELITDLFPARRDLNRVAPGGPPAGC